VLPPGSALRAAVQACAAHGGEGAELRFALVGSSVAADVAALSLNNNNNNNGSLAAAPSFAAAAIGSSALAAPVLAPASLTPTTTAAARSTSTSTLVPAADETRLALARLPLSELLASPTRELHEELSFLGRNAQSLGVLNVRIGGRDAIAAMQRAPAASANPGSIDEELRAAACRGDAVEIARCLGAGADVSKADYWGQTALHWAAASGSAAALELVLQSGGNVHTANRAGMTPLHWSAAWGHARLAKLLLAAGADKGARDVAGATAAARALSLNPAPPRGELHLLANLLGEQDTAAAYIQRRLRASKAHGLARGGPVAPAAGAQEQAAHASRRRQPSKAAEALPATVAAAGHAAPAAPANAQPRRRRG